MFVDFRSFALLFSDRLWYFDSLPWLGSRGLVRPNTRYAELFLFAKANFGRILAAADKLRGRGKAGKVTIAYHIVNKYPSSVLARTKL